MRNSIKSKSFGKGGRKPDKGRKPFFRKTFPPFNLTARSQSQRAGNLTPEGRLAAQLALNRSDALEHRGMTAGKFVADVTGQLGVNFAGEIKKSCCGHHQILLAAAGGQLLGRAQNLRTPCG